MTLEIKDITGGYSAVPVLNNVSFSVKKGELTGLIGLNGAGKSTTIKHIIGLMQPFSGTISINGQMIKQNPKAYRQAFAFVPETPVLYEELTLKEHIEITAMAYDIAPEVARERAADLLKVFRLENRIDWFPANFSKGMKQKVMILCALITEPSLLIVDEPFLGLDPLAIHALLQLFGEMKKRGVSILMSTHVLATAQQHCDRFIILHEGQIRAQGTIAALQQEFDLPEASLDDIYLALTKEA